MAYLVKEIFYTLQGEGANTGRAAVFLRFAGCNLWSGRVEDRNRGAGGCSRWCDTDFVGTNGNGGGRFDNAAALADAVRVAWARRPGAALVVCTGGEPLLQLDAALIDALHEREFEIAIETNGTIVCPPGVDWICVSPKRGANFVQKWGNELKLVWPQEGLDPSQFESMAFERLFLQPMDVPNGQSNIALAASYCLEHPRWRLSLQTHKWIGLP